MIKKKLWNKANRVLYKKPLRPFSAMGDQSHYISFTFDDFAASAAKQGMDALDFYDVKATFYTSLGLLGKEEYGKPMFSRQDLESIQQAGHEIGCHTYYHSDFHQTSIAKLKESLDRNTKELATLFPSIKITSFAYPKGRVVPRGKKLINQIYQSGRTTKKGLNHVGDDLNMLRANKLYSKSGQLQNCYDLIDENKAKGSWLIFYTHDVEDKPSDFGCTKTFFEQVLKYAIDSGAEILPIGDLVLKNIQGA